MTLDVWGSGLTWSITITPCHLLLNAKANLSRIAYNDWVWFNSLSKKNDISYDGFDCMDDIFVCWKCSHKFSNVHISKLSTLVLSSNNDCPDKKHPPRPLKVRLPPYNLRCPWHGGWGNNMYLHYKELGSQRQRDLTGRACVSGISTWAHILAIVGWKPT